MNIVREYKVTVFVTGWVLGDGFNSGLVEQVTAEWMEREVRKREGRVNRKIERGSDPLRILVASLQCWQGIRRAQSLRCTSNLLSSNIELNWTLSELSDGGGGGGDIKRRRGFRVNPTWQRSILIPTGEEWDLFSGLGFLIQTKT